MITLEGKYNKDCKIFTDDIEENSYALIQNILNEKATENTKVNRDTILKIISKELNITIENSFQSVHNFIDFEDFIIRKGAIRSYENEKMIIPFNMRDGILICEGKSNEDWNCSAPHGAGRVLSRTDAKNMIDMNDFIDSMKGIYSSSICEYTLDEAPQAYKDSKKIEELIEPTANIIDRLKPVLNIKATRS